MRLARLRPHGTVSVTPRIRILYRTVCVWGSGLGITVFCYLFCAQLFFVTTWDARAAAALDFRRLLRGCFCRVGVNVNTLGFFLVPVMSSAVRQRAATLLRQCLEASSLHTQATASRAAARLEAAVHAQQSRAYEAGVRKVVQHVRRHGAPTELSELEAFAIVSAATDKPAVSGHKRPRHAGPQQVMQRTEALRITPPMAQDADRFAMVVPRVFSEEECAALIRETEAHGYAPASMRTMDDNAVMMPHVRDNERVVRLDAERAALVWDRIRSHVPSPWRGQQAVGCNPMLRFYRYDTGQSFAKHTDEPPYCAPTGEASLLTCLVYLSDGFDGGTTRLCTYSEPDERAVDVVPVRGSCFLFEHSLLHSSTPLRTGRKYVMRTDVMFRFERAPPRALVAGGADATLAMETTETAAHARVPADREAAPPAVEVTTLPPPRVTRSRSREQQQYQQQQAHGTATRAGDSLATTRSAL